MCNPIILLPINITWSFVVAPFQSSGVTFSLASLIYRWCELFLIGGRKNNGRFQSSYHKDPKVHD
ncbi:hypothetical protein MA16_Dca029075 [Dendrobium catenatum]|uniref:Uncharacterized protein n=1 Tax=Dendrobium catenatum TaxID=906689 RepID=A0A2I0VFH4_9ASPA|nr:hypothetical protein MA16_Dca029075 [Dendrobium catenatum]